MKLVKLRQYIAAVSETVKTFSVFYRTKKITHLNFDVMKNACQLQNCQFVMF